MYIFIDEVKPNKPKLVKRLLKKLAGNKNTTVEVTILVLDKYPRTTKKTLVDVEYNHWEDTTTYTYEYSI